MTIKETTTVSTSTKFSLCVLVLLVCLTTTLPAVCPTGDLTNDCEVSVADLANFAEQWLAATGSAADFDDANGVNFADLALLAGNWRKLGGELVISEFMAINDDTYPDPEDPTKFWDWIEIYNPADVSVNLNGWWLWYRDTGQTNYIKWQFPAYPLEPGEFLVVLASEKNRRDPAKPLHTNFKIRGAGGDLRLVTEDGVTVSHEYFPYPEQLDGISYGLTQYAMTLVPTGATALYHVPTSADAGKNWIAIGADETGWDSGKTALGFSSAPEQAGQDIDSPSGKGSYSINSGVYTIKGGGRDIWNEADAFYYVYAPLKGDGELTARVVSMTNTSAWAKAGVMVRETLDAGSRHAMTVLTPGNGTDFQYRLSTDGMSTNAGPTAHSAPYWVRIIRQGSNFTGYVSPNGTTWTQQSQTTIEMTEDVYIGLCVTAHDDYETGLLCTAVFDNVSSTSEVTSNLKQKMLGINSSLWTRMKFNLEEGQAEMFDRLNLRVKYEDGFVAYLNGQEVARRNAPQGTLPWNAASDSNRPDNLKLEWESINLTAYKNKLQDGLNVLAIHALNDTRTTRNSIFCRS
jgi:hypothetical protein